MPKLLTTALSCLIVWFWCFVRCNPRTVEMGLQVLYPFVEAGKAEDLKAEYALSMALHPLRHAGRLTYSNQRRRRPWTQRRPDEHLDRSQDEGFLAQGLPPQRPPKLSQEKDYK